MYRRILLAYDGTHEGRTALREGALLARNCGAEVHLLCIIPDSPGVHIAEGSYAGAVVLTEERYRALFEEALSRLRELGFAPRGRMVTGEPAIEIAAYAKHISADLVVVGHRRKSLLERWWSGQSGAYLVDHIGCSLLIARSKVTDAEFRRALAPGVGAA